MAPRDFPSISLCSDPERKEQPMLILVVDDSAMMREYVGGVLKEAGSEIIEAPDGQVALEILRGRSDIKCIICDVHMPLMDGVELVEEISKLPSPPPVVMHTTESKSQLVHRALAAGVAGWVQKPCKPHLLVAAARKLTGTTVRHMS